MTAKNRVDYIAIEEDAVLKFQFALIDAMNQTGLSKADLARALGVSKSRISQLLDSEANPTLKVMARALHFLGCEADYLPVHGSVKSRKGGLEEKSNGLAHFLSVVEDSEPSWAIHEQRQKAPANEDRLWGYLRESQAA